jgi:hypothetical protein
MRTRRLVPLGLLVGAGLLALGGCGNPLGKISGQVTLNGEPVRAARVTAYNEKGELLAQALIIDGKYELANLPLGSVVLTVETHTPDGQAITNYRPSRDYEKALPVHVKQELQKKQREGQELPATLQPVPLKYTSTRESDLRVTIAKGNVEYDIAMTGKGEIPRAPLASAPGRPGLPPGVLPPGVTIAPPK